MLWLRIRLDPDSFHGVAHLVQDEAPHQHPRVLPKRQKKNVASAQPDRRLPEPPFAARVEDRAVEFLAPHPRVGVRVDEFPRNHKRVQVSGGTPLDLDLVLESAAEEDGVQVAKRFDHDVRTPIVILQDLAKAADGLHLRSRRRSTWLVVVDDFLGCLHLADEWTRVGAKGFEGVEVFLADVVWRPLVDLDVEKGLAVEFSPGLDWWIDSEE